MTTTTTMEAESVFDSPLKFERTSPDGMDEEHLQNRKIFTVSDEEDVDTIETIEQYKMTSGSGRNTPSVLLASKLSSQVNFQNSKLVGTKSDIYLRLGMKVMPSALLADDNLVLNGSPSTCTAQLQELNDGRASPPELMIQDEEFDIIDLSNGNNRTNGAMEELGRIGRSYLDTAGSADSSSAVTNGAKRRRRVWTMAAIVTTIVLVIVIIIIIVLLTY